MKYKAIISVLAGLLLSCGTSTPKNVQSSSNTEVIVHYNGVEVSRRGGKYLSKDQLTKLSNQRQDLIIIFSADWCKSCKSTRNIMKRMNLKTKVYYLNLDELWVRQLAAMFKIKQVPFMIHVGVDGNTKAAALGPTHILEYLAGKF